MQRKNEVSRTSRGRRTRTRGGLAAVLLAGTIAVAGCGASGSSDDGAGVSHAEAPAGDVAKSDPGAQGDQERTSEAGASQSDADGPDGDSAADTADAADRHVIRTAALTVETKDVPDGLDEARSAVSAAGGYVSEETTDRDADGEERSRITFKVPPEEYEGVLDRLAGIGKLLERDVSTEDVTGDVVDTESRIETQKASVARVRKLMDDATELSDVVTLESELNTRQADLEALQARLKSLESRSGMATVTMELRTPDAAPVEKEKDEDPTVGGAVSGGWGAFVTMLTWIAVAIGASLPFLASLALLYVLWRAVRGRLPRRTVQAPPPVAVPPARETEPAKPGQG